MSKEIPTPYMWGWQPQMGAATGASQDYSTRMYWLSAGPSMIATVNGLRDIRNGILLNQAHLTETPRNVFNPRQWPAPYLFRRVHAPVTLPLPRDPDAEAALGRAGLQLAGGLASGIKGCGIQLNDMLPRGPQLRPDGVFQLAGGSAVAPRRSLLALQAAPSVPRSGGVGSAQFVAEFVPSVYFNPYAGPPGTYPDEFHRAYDIRTDSVHDYN